MRALIADPDRGAPRCPRGRAAPPRLRDSRCVDAAPAQADGFDLICLGGDGALDACRRLAGSDAIVILLARRAAGRRRGRRGRRVGAARRARQPDPVAHHFARLQTEHVRDRRRVRAAAPRAGPHRDRLRPHRPAARGPPDRLRQPVAFLEMTGYDGGRGAGPQLPLPAGPRDRSGACRRAAARGARAAAGDRRAAQLPQGRQRRSGTRSTSRPCATSAARSCASSASRSTSRPTARRARATARGRQTAERRSAFLAEASPRLDASLDLRSTLDSLTRLVGAVPGRRLHRRRGPAATRCAGSPRPRPTR